MTYDIQKIDTHIELVKVLLWQYNSADGDSIEGLLRSKSEWYELYVSGFWESWYNDVFNIQTANEFGLSVWAIILGVSFEIPDCPNRSLTVEQKRLIIRLRFYQITTRATVPMINAELLDIFGQGAAYVLDPLNMSPITYVFKRQPSPDVALVLTKYDLLPRPSAVGVTYRVEANLDVFGFGEFNQNFDNGAFYNGDALISYDWDLTLLFNKETGLVQGTLSAGDPEQDLAGYQVTLLYTDRITQEKMSHTVVTASDGWFVDNDTPAEGKWSVVAKIQIDTPICTTLDVESAVVDFSKIVYKFAITGAYDETAKQVKGQLTCNENVDLSKQSVVITYRPDDANGEGQTPISHTVSTDSDGYYADAATPNHGRYKTDISCHVVLVAEEASGDVSVPQFEFTNIDYKYTISINYDGTKQQVYGKITCNQPRPYLGNVFIELFYYERNGNKNVTRSVRTDSEGNYVDTNPPGGIEYTVFASTSLKGPFQDQASRIVSERIKYEIVYTYNLVISYADDKISGQIIRSAGSNANVWRQLVTLTYRNAASGETVVTHNFETDGQGRFSDANLPTGGAFKVVATCTLKPTYGGTVPLTSNTVEYKSIAPGAQYIMTVYANRPVAYVANEELDGLMIDWGDGKGPGQNFEAREGTGQNLFKFIIAGEGVPLRERLTITVTGSHTIRFCNETGTRRTTFCPLHELIYVASNSRTSMATFAPYTDIERIHPGAFDAIPNNEAFTIGFSQCQKLVEVEDGVFNSQTKLLYANKVFPNCKNLAKVPNGIFDPSASVCVTIAETFTGCEALTGNINEIYAETYPAVNQAESLFYNCGKVTGSQSEFRAKLPLLEGTNGQAVFNMFKGADNTSE